MHFASKSMPRLALQISLLFLISCMSVQNRNKVVAVIKGCPTYEETVAFPTPAILPKKEEKKEEPVVAEAPVKDSESKFLDKMFLGIKKEFEDSGVKLEEIADGFKGHGISLEKVKGTDGKTKEIKICLDGDVGFDHGSSRLTRKATEIVDKVAKAVAQYPEANVKVGGHTDSIGALFLNQKLSQDRAQAVRDRLVKSGPIDPARIVEVKGFADTRKVINTMAAEPRNRRVEMRLVIA